MSGQDSSLLYWIALNRIPGISVKQFHALAGYGEHHLENIFNFSDTEFRKIPYMTPLLFEKLRRFSFYFEEAKREQSWIEKNNIIVKRLVDEDYPPLLKRIADPPPLLYIKGRGCTRYFGIGIVGTRQATPYGLSVTDQLCSALVSVFRQYGVIISGLAAGIDAKAHETALQHEGKTIAVLGNGLSIVYPSENRWLYQKISEEGVLMSEFPFDAMPSKYSFPRRNRVVSGLSHGIVVIEAPLKSGALITAEYALEQGREVFSVPGPVTSEASAGTHMLIKQGAHLVMSADDILNAFPEYQYEFKKESLTENEQIVHSLGHKERHILELLNQNQTFESMVDMSVLETYEVSEILLDLQLKGLILKQNQEYTRNLTWRKHSL